MHILRAQTIRSLDEQTIKSGTPGEMLMERAGRGAFRFLTRVAAPGARRFLVASGKGNNAGDAFVVARYLREHGMHVDLLTLAPPQGLSNDARLMFDRAVALGIPVSHGYHELDLVRLFSMWHGDAIIDGVLGTGVHGAVSGVFWAAIQCMNGHAAPVCALDVPSGLDSDTGEPCGVAVHARWTAMFASAKHAILSAGGAACCGRAEVIDIGIKRDLVAAAGEKEHSPACALSSTEVAELLPRRALQDHKNRFGHLLVIAGSRGMTGAAVLCAQSALKAGAGLVTVAVPQSLLHLVAPCIPACMTLPVPDNNAGRFTEPCFGAVAASLDRFTAIAVGPGMGTHDDTVQFLAKLAAMAAVPMVIDADALNIIAAQPYLEAALKGRPVVLTPHPGEFARLSKSAKPSDAAAERIAAAQTFADERQVALVLKGFQSVIAAPDTGPILNLTGNPGMATAGAGDVLTGIIGSLLAQGVKPRDAAAAGCYLHGLAGDIAAGNRAMESLTAPDMAEALGEAFKYVHGS